MLIEQDSQEIPLDAISQQHVLSTASRYFQDIQKTRKTPVFAAEFEDYSAGSGLVCGHHIYPVISRFCVPCGGKGLVNPLLSGLRVEQYYGCKLLCRGVGPGIVAGADSVDIQHRPLAAGSPPKRLRA